MKMIPLTRGKVALVDDADFEATNAFKWHAMRTAPGVYYAARTQYDLVTKKKSMVLMHRQIMNPPKGVDVDHEHRDRLDNQKSNLRLCSRSQNLAAIPTLGRWRGRVKTCKFRGVAKHSSGWTAQISVQGKKKHLGCFSLPEDAARAYDAAARERSGEFATVNFRE